MVRSWSLDLPKEGTLKRKKIDNEVAQLSASMRAST
jgi:hypothetical protein